MDIVLGVALITVAWLSSRELPKNGELVGARSALGVGNGLA